MKLTFLALLLSLSISSVQSQTIRPDLKDPRQWRIINRKMEVIQENKKASVRLNALPGDGLLLLNGSKFGHGTVEFDVKGKNSPMHVRGLAPQRQRFFP